jgi:hypothetical protein
VYDRRPCDINGRRYIAGPSTNGQVGSGEGIDGADGIVSDRVMEINITSSNEPQVVGIAYVRGQ